MSTEALTEEWLRLDENESTRREVLTLLDSGDLAELRKRMVPRISFGTAGIRGKMQAGWSCMNDLIIIQTSQGLCEYALSHIRDSQRRGVVIGYDHRRNSERWAYLTANVFASKGMKVYLHRGPIFTPLVPYSVARLKAACGVMITASHNPKNDNGYKVYWENAVQIISPHDAGISDCILQNQKVMIWSVEILSPLIEDCTTSMREGYFNDLSSLCRNPIENRKSSVVFVNTSMHGVSHNFLSRAFDVFRLPLYVPVLSQRDPDNEFPTVRFPNPEEKGALTLALEFAVVQNADYVLAQDPDADRFCASERRPDGRWHRFTGDQLGILFAAWTIETLRCSGGRLESLAMVSSVVSSRMLEKMARVEGFRYEECLTGFKYIGNQALSMESKGIHRVLFGYEEAIGFMFTALDPLPEPVFESGYDPSSHCAHYAIKDKDGIAASVKFAEMVSTLKARGSSGYDYLQLQYRKYGYHETRNGHVLFSDATVKSKIFARLRQFPQTLDPEKGYPAAIANHAIYAVRDLTVGHAYDSCNPPSCQPTLPLSGDEMITFKAENTSFDSAVKTYMTLTIRASGTEPKIKLYLECCGQDVTAISRLLQEAVAEIATEWLQIDKYGLTMAV